MIENPPTDARDIGDMGRVSGLGNQLEKGMATHSNIPAWNSHGQRSLAGYSPQGHKEADMTEHTGTQHNDNPPSNLDSSWCFLQPSVSLDILCI